MKLTQLLQKCTYSFVSGPDADIADIVYDSRKAAKGTAFVCL